MLVLGIPIPVVPESGSLPAAPVVAQLETGHFFDGLITKKHLFASIHDAVVFALRHSPAHSATPVMVS